MSCKVTVLFHPKSNHRDRIKDAVAEARLLLRGYFGLERREAPWLPAGDSQRKSHVLRNKIAGRVPEGRVVAIVDALLEPDVIVKEYRGLSIVTTRDWEEEFAPPPLKHHLLFQLAGAFAIFSADLSDAQIDAWAHERPVGCLFDSYEDPIQLRRTMIAGQICSDHRNQLATSAVPEAAIADIEALLGSVRNAAVGRARNLGSSVFIGHGHGDDWKQVADWARDELRLHVVEFNAEAAQGITIGERLSTMLDQAAAAVMVMTAEIGYPDQSFHARENVVHEIGLLQGRLGFRRVAILRDSQVQKFSNLEGLTVIDFEKGQFNSSPNVRHQLRRFLEREGLLERIHSRSLPAIGEGD
jgi:predicted nucleotide-binding protein